jgi:BirA family biotin operon repressor/biotin-[acetyl-CoA-carboxylase] ligase
VVVGIGINVTLRREDLPTAAATSLLVEKATGLDREDLLGAVLHELEHRYLAEAAARDADDSGLRADYLSRCATIGQQVRVELPGGRSLTGIAADVDTAGRLVVRTPDRVTAVSAGDVVHVR